MKFSFWLFSSGLFFSFHALATSSGVTIGLVESGGSGCSAGTVSVEQSNNQINSIHFHDFKLSLRSGLERKACNLAIPLQVPQGVQVGIGPVDEISGFHSLPDTSARLVVNQEVFFAGSRGKVIPFSKKGNASGVFKISNETSLKDLKWSPCGQSVNLRVNLTASLTSKSRKLAFVALEDLKLTKSGRLYWRQCE